MDPTPKLEILKNNPITQKSIEEINSDLELNVIYVLNVDRP